MSEAKYGEIKILKAVEDGTLRIDEDGTIWRLRNRHRKPCKPHRAEYMLPTGYLRVSATINGRRISVYAHRLFWTQLHGRIPLGRFINHRNGVKNDNRPSNLELVTSSENTKHAFTHLGVEAAKGERSSQSKLTDALVRQIHKLRSQGLTYMAIAKELDSVVNTTSIGSVINGLTWKHVGANDKCAS